MHEPKGFQLGFAFALSLRAKEIVPRYDKRRQIDAKPRKK